LKFLLIKNLESIFGHFKQRREASFEETTRNYVLFTRIQNKMNIPKKGGISGHLPVANLKVAYHL